MENKKRNVRNDDNNWIPERNIVKGFTFKGFLIFIIILIIGSLVNYFLKQ
ncbi:MULTISPECIES: hypothetical protein [unclassified Lysinibacillus]